MNWIKCSERFPEKCGRYLVFERKGEHYHNLAAYNYPIVCCKPNIAYFRSFLPDKWQWNSFDDTNCTPTHWMPLPENPNE